MALASIQASLTPSISWSTAGLIGTARGAKMYVDIINHGKSVLNLRIIIQLVGGNYGDKTIAVPVSAPGTAGFRSLSLGTLFNNEEAGNVSVQFIADQPCTVKVTQEVQK